MKQALLVLAGLAGFSACAADPGVPLPCGATSTYDYMQRVEHERYLRDDAGHIVDDTIIDDAGALVWHEASQWEGDVRAHHDAAGPDGPIDEFDATLVDGKPATGRYSDDDATAPNWSYDETWQWDGDDLLAYTRDWHDVLEPDWQIELSWTDDGYEISNLVGNTTYAITRFRGRADFLGDDAHWTHRETDEDDDGTVDSATDQTYDAHDQLLTVEESDRDAGGLAVWGRGHYDREADGSATQWRWDVLDQPGYGVTTAYLYQCE